MLRTVTPIAELSFVSTRAGKALEAAGLRYVGELLRIPPKRYEDRRSDVPLSSLADGETACLRLRILSVAVRFSYTRFVEAVATTPEQDTAGAHLLLRWYNMPYVAKMLAAGVSVSVYGKVRIVSRRPIMCNPDFEVLEDAEDAGRQLAAAAMGEPTTSANCPAVFPKGECIHTGRIVPIYRSIPGISARSLRNLVWTAIAQLDPDSPWEPYNTAPQYPLSRALADLHFPADMATAHKARLRLALSECFCRQITVAWQRAEADSLPGLNNVSTDYYCRELLQELPFSLTQAQMRCLREIRADMSSDKPMHRLLQGDVGSGKTLVALYAMLLCFESGRSAALLAPTQILAEQHYQTFCRLLRNTDIPISLRTAGKSDNSDFVYIPGNSRHTAAPRLIIGTHALLYSKHRPSSIGLAVIDEQHKFGVAQRERFVNAIPHPDVLVMTATPIPRTLTLTLYGDLDVSVIDELPPGRGEIVTTLCSPRHIKRIVNFLKTELSAGRQAYIISPLIDRSEASERRSATQEAQHWAELLPEYNVGLLHGRMSQPEKENAMKAFVCGETRLLVSTTVVEVGVDVPNATIMIINNADSFGISQLHQLRGRIGRGKHKSRCILLSDANPGTAAREKLDILCRTTNGFEIAEADFRLRGPGDVLGTAQSGLASVLFPEWLSDTRLIYRANDLAASILTQDPSLRLPQHSALRDLVRSAAASPRHAVG